MNVYRIEKANHYDGDIMGHMETWDGAIFSSHKKAIEKLKWVMEQDNVDILYIRKRKVVTAVSTSKGIVWVSKERVL